MSANPIPALDGQTDALAELDAAHIDRLHEIAKASPPPWLTADAHEGYLIAMDKILGFIERNTQ